ncbi:hypothetical protein EDB86DRAFT_2076461 [Lactarius hatsudake]|nr:hypothetical protein EDB86DRAFT_2076461 [Lactarius hatsudake]
MTTMTRMIMMTASGCCLGCCVLPLSAESTTLPLPGAVENGRHRRRRRLWCHNSCHRQLRVRFLTKATTCTVSQTPPPWSMMHRLIGITHGPSLPRAVVRPHARVADVIRPEQPEHVPPEANIPVVSYNLYYLNRNNPIIVQPLPPRGYHSLPVV